MLKMGKICIVSSIGIILLYMIYANVSTVLPSNKMTFLVLSTAIFITAVGSLLTGEVGVKGGNAQYKRSENPRIYWFVVLLQILLALFLMLFAFK